MEHIEIIIYIIAAPLFLISLAAYIYTQIRLHSTIDSELDEYYYELEEQHPGYIKYLKWSRITLAAASISALLLFIALVI